MNMLKQLNSAIEYIEANLCAEFDLDTAAGIACVTADSFIRFFSYMTGMTLTEYIRRRRLTLAAQDLQHRKTPIIDIAIKYGYDSAAAFSRAFAKQHGITPSVYRKDGGSLKVYSPASFHIMIKGAKEMDFRIIELADTVMYGVSKLYFDGRHIITPYIEELQGKFHAPVSGDIACGSPIYAEERHDDTFPIPTDFIGKGEYFWLRAKGDSMINAGIDSGDLVLIHKQNTANEGDIVVALIDDSATLKTFSYDRANRKVVLKAENDDKKNYPNQIYDNIIIQGVAEHVLKRISMR